MARVRRRWLVLTMAVAVACPPTIAAIQDAAAAFALPKSVEKALEKRWKNWRPAPLPAGCTATQGGPAPLVDGDFNSDGRADVVVSVTTDKGPMILAAIVRLEDATLFDVDAVPAGGAAITVRKRGTKYFRKDFTIDQYFGADTIVVSPCGGAGDAAAYTFTGSGFRREVIAQLLHN